MEKIYKDLYNQETVPEPKMFRTELDAYAFMYGHSFAEFVSKIGSETNAKKEYAWQHAQLLYEEKKTANDKWWNERPILSKMQHSLSLPRNYYDTPTTKKLNAFASDFDFICEVYDPPEDEDEEYEEDNIN